jgi:hypothetical protein
LIGRRAWLAGGAAGLGMSLLSKIVAHGEGPEPESPPRRPQGTDEERLKARKRDILRRLLYSRDDLNAWLSGKAFPFSKYDGELGYLHVDRQFKEGVDGSVCTYRYDASGARHMLAAADRPCRINTYGNSFTSCEQVSDGETWQEVLAAHLGEPIRNFGIGGYSVYQAYLRMHRDEQRSPAQYIIFNIFDDDHYRNLHGWQRLRFGVNRKSTNPPVPHVKVDPDAGKFVECPNPCPTAESLYQLCDLNSAYSLFAVDHTLDRNARRDLLREQGGAIVSAGSDFDDSEFTRRALYATMRIVEKVEEFAAPGNRKVLYVLSYGGERVRRFLRDGTRFDRSLVEFFDRRHLPYVDLLKAHAADFAKSAPDIDAYLKRYYIGHYNPLGNFFCAFALKDQLVRRLDPPSPAYAPTTRDF